MQAGFVSREVALNLRYMCLHLIVMIIHLPVVDSLELTALTQTVYTKVLRAGNHSTFSTFYANIHIYQVEGNRRVTGRSSPISFVNADLLQGLNRDRPTPSLEYVDPFHGTSKLRSAYGRDLRCSIRPSLGTSR